MLRKVFLSLVAGFCVFSAVIGCSNEISSQNDLVLMLAQSASGKKSAVEYGSITVETSRSLDAEDITGASVTVSGYGISDISGTVTMGETAGTGTATVEKVPVGRRVVTVTSNVSGAVMRAVVDVKAGSNSVTVNWDSTAVGNVYYYLIKTKKVEIANIDESAFSGAIDSSVHPALIDAEAIAKAYPSVGSASSYVSGYGTVSVTSSNASGLTLQVTDVASEKLTFSSSVTGGDLLAYPGTWKAKVLNADGTVVAEKDITVVAGEITTVDVSYQAAGEQVSFSDKTIVFVKASSAPTLWAWEPDGASLSELAGQSWPGNTMTAVTSAYMSDYSGWYMADFTSYATGEVIHFKLNSGSEITGKAGTFWYDGSSCSSTNPSPVVSTEDKVVLTVNSAEEPGDAVKIYVSASSAPSLWVWQPSGLECTKLMGYSWSSQPTCADATDLIYGEGWYVLSIPSDYYTAGAAFSFIINSGSTVTSTKTGTFWYDAAGVSGTAGTFYDSDPTVKPEPVAPTVSIKPKSGKEVGPADAISVTFGYGYDEENFSASVTVAGTTYRWGTDFTGKTFTKSVKSLGLTSSGSISVSASCSNSAGNASDSASLTYNPDKAEDPFTWDNANVYFVLTDRFNNGDSSNDHGYGRSNNESNSNVPDIATFHGGDIAGLTAKLDYFDKLGVNAIWITAPYEQIHGWVGGKNKEFPHYAYHGYYTLDWTSMDANMGTVEEFRTFVNACHSKGIRVVMDIVMNHVGYNNLADMITYNFGETSITDATWISTTDGLWDANVNADGSEISWTTDAWENWWGPWIRSFAYESGSEYGGSCGGLPDVKHEIKTSVGMAPVMTTKWGKDTSSYKSAYYNPSVENADWNGYSGNYRKDRDLDPGTYQVIWLSAWVRELGIDGFRCDTAKHVEPERWGQLKVACQAALEAWREDSSKSKTYNGKDTGAADWDESFWMTGECFGWTSTAGAGEYYTTGKFDSMINFSFNASAGSGTSSSYPSEGTWSSYLSINNNDDSDGNGNRNNVLTYISSHDTKLCRASNQTEVGTMLQLTPGGVQIYYGDETSRPLAYTSCCDTDMQTRGDFNWDAAEGACATHWGKVGNFRKYNPAVGAGTGTAYKRTYSGSAGENKVAISISGTDVDVSGLFDDGTKVYNWYDGTSATVSGGSVSFAGGTTTQPILVSEKNPKDYGLFGSN